LRGRVRKIKSQIEFEKDKNKKAELQEVLKKTMKELTEISAKIKSTERLRSLNRNGSINRQTSRKSRLSRDKFNNIKYDWIYNL
jgi:hypothetical protein